MSARLHFTPLHPHPPLARAWWGPWPRRGSVPWRPRAVRPARMVERVYGRIAPDALGALIRSRMEAVTSIKALPLAETKPRERRKG